MDAPALSRTVPLRVAVTLCASAEPAKMTRQARIVLTNLRMGVRDTIGY
jgi:hypothetical protein